MKYIKAYEKLIQHTPKFEIGQTVICIDDSYAKSLSINKKYIIEDIIRRLFSQKIDGEIIDDEYYVYKNHHTVPYYFCPF